VFYFGQKYYLARKEVNNMKRTILSSAIGLGMVIAAAVPAFAANNCGNRITGPFSGNICTRALNKVNSVGVSNSGSVNHNINTNSVSGGNTATLNTNGGGVGAGAADVNTDNQAQLNTGEINLVQSDPVSEDNGYNDTTGPFSTNVATFTTNKVATVNVVNSGTIVHNVTSNSVSGNNTVSLNTVGGTITTGPATTTHKIISVMNDTVINVTQ
jgi:hypothetical protein